MATVAVKKYRYRCLCRMCRGTRWASYSTTRNHLSVYGEFEEGSLGKLPLITVIARLPSVAIIQYPYDLHYL
jgi:hypothetical protein